MSKLTMPTHGRGPVRRVPVWIACLVLAATAAASNLSAEAHCPGNVSSVPYRVINRHQMVVALSVNHSGPYPFLFDTGTQMTMIDPALADQLHLSTSGDAAVVNGGTNGSARLSQVDLAELGTHMVEGLKVVVYDLDHLRVGGMNVRGVLGEDFLEHFDLLIDNAHSLLCLDDTGAMRAEVKGERVPLVPPAGNEALARSLIVSVRLSDGMRPVRLKLDSGANTSFLFNPSSYLAIGFIQGASLRGDRANGSAIYKSLPLQTMRIGAAEFPRVQFVSLAGATRDARTSDFDGLLTLGIFRRIFIDHSEHLAVLDPH